MKKIVLLMSLIGFSLGAMEKDPLLPSKTNEQLLREDLNDVVNDGCRVSCLKKWASGGYDLKALSQVQVSPRQWSQRFGYGYKDLMVVAVQGGSKSLAKNLVVHGFPLNRPCSEDKFPLALAINKGWADVALLMIEKGASLKDDNTHNFYPLLAAFRDCKGRGREELIHAMLARGADYAGKVAIPSLKPEGVILPKCLPYAYYATRARCLPDFLRVDAHLTGEGVNKKVSVLHALAMSQDPWSIRYFFKCIKAHNKLMLQKGAPGCMINIEALKHARDGWEQGRVAWDYYKRYKKLSPDPLYRPKQTEPLYPVLPSAPAQESGPEAKKDTTIQ